MAKAAHEGLGRQLAAGNVELHGHCNCYTIHHLSKELKHALLTEEGNHLNTALPNRSGPLPSEACRALKQVSCWHQPHVVLG